MQTTHEPHRLVIQNLDVLEAAPPVVYDVERRVFSAIDGKLRKWMEAQGDWEGVFDYVDQETSFKPQSWETAEDGTYRAYFALAYDGTVKDSYYLSALLGVVTGRFGLWFKVDTTWVTRLGGKGARPSAEWKRYLAEQFAQRRLGDAGYELHGEGLVLPIRVNSATLAEDYPDSLSDSLSPVDDALLRLQASVPLIQSLLEDALAYQFGERR